MSIFKLIYIVASAERYVSNARDTTDRHTLVLAHSKIIIRFFETQELRNIEPRETYKNSDNS